MAPMPEEKTHSGLSAAWQGLEDEFVPLPVAATVTYFHVTDALRQVSSEEDLVRERSAALSLANLAIRRGDLRAAMTTLKEARLAFGRRS